MGRFEKKSGFGDVIAAWTEENLVHHVRDLQKKTEGRITVMEFAKTPICSMEILNWEPKWKRVGVLVPGAVLGFGNFLTILDKIGAEENVKNPAD